jgi:hypothetical protein
VSGRAFNNVSTDAYERADALMLCSRSRHATPAVALPYISAMTKGGEPSNGGSKPDAARGARRRRDWPGFQVRI